MRSTLVALTLLALGGVALGQAEDGAAPAEVERVYVPSKGFQKVLRRHPRGVLITEAELEKLLRLAGRRPPAVVVRTPPAPVAAAIQRLELSGKVEQGVASLTADARVSVLAPGQVGLPLPLAGIGLRGVWVDGRPARVIVTARGPEVLLAGSADAATPETRRVTWELARTVAPGEGRGSGAIDVPVPAAAAGRYRIDLPGDVELRASGGAVSWTAKPAGGRTIVQGAFGGGAKRSGRRVKLRWRPRRSLERVTPYVVAGTRTRFVVQQGVVALHSLIRLRIHRAERERFELELPAGFVVTKLRMIQGAVTHVQRGDRVDVRLDAPRRGEIALQLSAELSLAGGKRARAQDLSLRPIRFLDVDRVGGVLGITRGPHAQLRFGEVRDLARADLSALRLTPEEQGAPLVRVYHRDHAAGRLALTVAPLAPRVDLNLTATVQVREREVRAVALYRYRVEQGSVFTLRAVLPKGYDLEDTLLLQAGRPVPHALNRRRLDDGRVALAVELERALTRGQELLFAVEAVAEHPRGVAGATLDVPRFEGRPATRFAGNLGLAPIRTFQLRGRDLSGLTAIPARELRRRGGRGIEWSDIVLGYRLEKPDYAGRVTVRTKQRRVTVESLAYHSVGEQTVSSDIVLDLEVRGAPTDSLILLFPPGVGALAKVEGPGAAPDRAGLGTDADGWERFRVSFRRPVSGKVRLRVRFDAKLAGGGATILHRVARVSVEGAVRARGTLAVFSSGSTELSETAEKLSRLDVTEVPAHPFLPPGRRRPLLAYTHVGSDHALTLRVTRHGQADTLTAVAESLSLATSVGPDGTARHSATFRIKNLGNQYFALRLPEDAVLWSIVVDGEGVKPAGEGGERIVPIPTAGKSPDASTTVVATYSSRGARWGTFGDAALVAPELKFGAGADSVTDTVPVLHTTWALSLPDDYRVLEFDGNVNGQAVPRVGALAVAAWSGLKTGPWRWLAIFALLGLAAAASRTIRGGLLAGLWSARAAAREAKDGLVGAAASPAARRRVLGAVGIVALLGGAVWLFKVAGADRFAKSAPETAAKLGVDRGSKSAGKTAARRWSEDAKKRSALPPRVPPPASLVPPEPPKTQASNAEPMPGDKAPRKNRPVLEKEEARQGAELQKKRQRREPGPAGDPAAGKPRAGVPGRLRGEGGRRKKPRPQPRPGGGMKFDGDGAAGGDAPDDAPVERKLADRLKDANDDEKPAAAEDEAEGDDQDYGAVDAEAMNRPALAAVEPEVAKTLLGPGGWGQVGLRSLVVQLASVGHTRRFARAGGGARLEVGFVQEALLIGLGGLLALLGFLAALTLPRLGRITGAGLLALTLVGLTAVPVLLPGSALTALLNALTLGLVLGGCGLGLVGLARWWSTAPLSRLGQALDAYGRTRADG